MFPVLTVSRICGTDDRDIYTYIYIYIYVYRRSYLKFSSYDTGVSSAGQSFRLSSALFMYDWGVFGCRSDLVLLFFVSGSFVANVSFCGRMTKPQQRKRNLFIVPPQKEAFATKLPVARKRKTTVQGRKGNQTHLSHTRRERRASDNFVLRLKHQCRMKRI